MAKNRTLERGREFSIAVPAETVSGQALVIEDLPCVALTNRRADGTASVQTDGVYELEVEGKNKAGEEAIEPGMIVYMKGGVLGRNNEEGKRFGYALGKVAKGKKEKIKVKIGY